LLWRNVLLGAMLAVCSAAAEEADPVSHYERGERLAAEGRLDLAIGEFEAARAAGAGSALFLNRLGALYLQTASYGKAAEVFRESLREKPEQLAVYARLGEAYLGAGQVDSAISWVRQALAIAPESSTVHSSLAYLLLRREPRDLAQAREHLDAALELDSTNVEALRFLGYYYVESDSVLRAIATYERLDALVPGDMETLNNLGYLHLERNEYAKAVDYYRRAVAVAQEPEMIYAINDRLETAEALAAGRMRARYILVRSRDQAEDLLARLRSGGDFEEIAKASSIATNAQAGGDTGFFARGEMLPAFEKIVLGLGAGELSDVVELPELGFAIVQRLH